MDNDIEKLANHAFRKRQHFEALGMQNVNGLSIEEREKQNSNYELAKAEAMKAEATLAKAQHLYASLG
jgi:hypothetical protein